MARYKETERQIEECYNHINSYLYSESATEELREMCKNCEVYSGTEHDFEECKDRHCFRFWLAYEYLEWLNSYGVIGGD